MTKVIWTDEGAAKPLPFSERLWIWGTVFLGVWVLGWFIGRPIARALGVF